MTNLSDLRLRLTFGDLPVGAYFHTTEDRYTVFEKLEDCLARGPKNTALGTGIYAFSPDEEVEEE